MKRFLLTLRFVGTAYHGWQVQQNADTVQAQVQDALERLLQVRPALTGCSRTDSGVHAERFCCHMDVEERIAPQTVLRGLNHYLPADIGVIDCREVSAEFHARYSCRSKEYLYRIWNGLYRNPFLQNRAYWARTPLSETTMHQAAQAFLGTHDFKAFCASGAKPGDTVRTIHQVSVMREGDLVTLQISANGFLYNMVRIIAGTLLAVSAGQIATDAISGILLSGKRENAGPTAPAHGLYLHRIVYDPADLILEGGIENA